MDNNDDLIRRDEIEENDIDPEFENENSCLRYFNKFLVSLLLGIIIVFVCIIGINIGIISNKESAVLEKEGEIAELTEEISDLRAILSSEELLGDLEEYLSEIEADITDSGIDSQQYLQLILSYTQYRLTQNLQNEMKTYLLESQMADILEKAAQNEEDTEVAYLLNEEVQIHRENAEEAMEEVDYITELLSELKQIVSEDGIDGLDGLEKMLDPI